MHGGFGLEYANAYPKEPIGAFFHAQECDKFAPGLKPPRFSSLNEARKGSTRPPCRVFSGLGLKI